MARDTRLTDPLSEVTRKERRLLLGLSVLSTFIIKADAVPTKISALGIEFGGSDQRVFLWLLVAVLVYFTLTFAVYALSDYVAWKKEILNDYVEGIKEYWSDVYPESRSNDSYEDAVQRDLQDAYKRNRIYHTLTDPVSICRALFEFVLPFLVGAIALAVVFQAL